MFCDRMEKEKSRPSLENKLLTSLHLQSKSLLLQSKHSLGGRYPDENSRTDSLRPSSQSLSNKALLGGLASPLLAGSKDNKDLQRPQDKPQFMKNTLLTSSISKELTQNKLLQRPNLSLSNKAQKKPQIEFKEEGRSSINLKNISNVSAIHSVKLNIRQSCHLITIDKSRTENSLLKASSLTTTGSILGHKANIKTEVPKIIGNWEKKAEIVDNEDFIDTDDLDDIAEAIQSRPVYELEFYEEIFSKELSGRITVENDFKAKVKGDRDPEAEKQLKLLEQTKVLFCRFAFF